MWEIENCKLEISSKPLCRAQREAIIRMCRNLIKNKCHRWVMVLKFKKIDKLKRNMGVWGNQRSSLTKLFCFASRASRASRASHEVVRVGPHLFVFMKPSYGLPWTKSTWTASFMKSSGFLPENAVKPVPWTNTMLLPSLSPCIVTKSLPKT